MKRFLLATALSLMSLTATVNAQNIRARQLRQQSRIARGIRTGALTPREASRLERQEGRLNREIRFDRVNGLTPGERLRINRQLNAESRRIYRQKHDAQVW